MIDPEGIRRKALRLYPAVLRAAIEEAAPKTWPTEESAPRPLFPLDVRADRGRSTDPFAERRKGIETLYAESKNRRGKGYTLLLREVSTRREGRQSVVDRIRFESREDYLAFLDKTGELDAFVQDACTVAGRLPRLTPWIQAEPLTFVRHLGEWSELVAVCEQLVQHPRPGCYARQLPVAVHTKFVEEHRGILQRLLDMLLPAAAIDPAATSFEGRYGLAAAEPLVRVRFLDPTLAPATLEDMAIPTSHLARLDVACGTAFIVENLLPFLAFPMVDGAICLWGGGFAASSLAATPWLRGCRILYWGDLDRAGFGILASLRLLLPRVVSMLMDEPTYRRYRAFAVAPPGGGAGPVGEAALRGEILTECERDAMAALEEDPARSRLEQERITHGDLVSYLAGAGFRVRR